MHEELRGILRHTARRLLWTRAAEAAAVGAVAGGLCAAALQLAGLLGWLHWRFAWAPLLAIPLGALVGAMARLVRPVTVLQAAAWLDAHGAYAEQCTTAAELMSSKNPDPPAVAYVCRKALEALRNDRRPLRFRRRGRATLGAIALAVLLCLTLALLPEKPAQSPWHRLAAQAAALSQPQRKQAAADLLRQAQQAEGDSALAQDLAQAAAALNQERREFITMDLAELQAALEQAPKEVAQAVMRALQDAVSGVEGAGEPSPAGAPQTALAPTTAPAARGDVTVYDPLYRPSGAATASMPTGSPQVPYQDAWTAAQSRAEAQLRTGQVPPEYRELVRKYFLSPIGDSP